MSFLNKVEKASSSSLISELHNHIDINDEYLSKIKKIIQELEQAIADKHIYNVRWNEGKELLNRAYEMGARKKISYEAPSYLYQLPSFAKKAPKSMTLAYWIKVADLLASAKSYIVKGRKPNPNAAPKPDEIINRNWSPALDMLEGKLKDIIKGTVAKFKEQVKQDIIEEGMKLWETIEQNNIQRSFALGKQYRCSPLSSLADLMFTNRGGRVQSYPKNEIDSFAEKFAETVTNESVIHFISKNKYKMAAFLKCKQIKDIKIMSMHVNNSIIHSQMRFTFEDDTEFTVRNQMVYGYSNQGTPFIRYPTTFHDVIIDGKHLSAPSELKIYKSFGIEKVPTN